MSKAQQHSAFNADIYRWTLTLPVGKWYPIAPKKMSVEEFTDCIKYLINCGEPLSFSEDLSAFRRDDFTELNYMGG